MARTLIELLEQLNVDDSARVSIAHTMGVSSDPASEKIARRVRRRPTCSAIAAHVRLRVTAEEADLLRAHGAREHALPTSAPATSSSAYRRPRRPPENARR